MEQQDYTFSYEQLKNIKLLSMFSEDELKSIASLGEKQNYESYSNIVIEGEMSWGFYVILKGSVRVFKNDQISGKSYDVGQLNPGEFFGELSLVDENPRSATVRALEPLLCCYVSKEKFEGFLNQSQERKVRFFEGCAKGLAQRLRELNDHYVVSQYQLWRSALDKSQERKMGA